MWDIFYTNILWGGSKSGSGNQGIQNLQWSIKHLIFYGGDAEIEAKY